MSLALLLATVGPVLEQRWRLLVIVGAWWVAFGVGATLVLRTADRRRGLVLVVVVAAALRIVALAGVPVLSDDVYRYAWDGSVQAAGFDPYRHPPTAEELAGLRGPWLWPDAAGCADLDRPPGCTRINRADQRTIYPPLAQVWFRVGDLLLPDAGEDRAWQGLALVVDLGLVAALALALARSGHDARSVVLYAWSPIAVLESAQSAHVDALAVLVTVGALYAARRPRGVLAGVLLGLATLIKLYPAALLPVVAGRRPRHASLTLVAFAATIGLGYARHAVAVGVDVLGYLPGYLAEEGYAGGSRFLLLGLVGLTGTPAQVVAGLGLAVAAVVAWRSRRAPEVAATLLFGTALLLATPVQPWYALLLVALATLARRWWWIAVAVAGYPVYLAALLDGPIPIIGRVSYGLAALVVVVGEARSCRSSRGVPSHDGSVAPHIPTPGNPQYQ